MSWGYDRDAQFWKRWCFGYQNGMELDKNVENNKEEAWLIGELSLDWKKNPGKSSGPAVWNKYRKKCSVGCTCLKR